jgi:hypothetical protein
MGIPPVARLLACAFMSALAAACSSAPTTYESDAINASFAGDQKKAIGLAKKEVARFATPDQCSPAKRINCGTLALSYGSLAEYQVLDGDRAGGETSLQNAKGALAMMDRTELPSATGMVYRGISDAYWKKGDQARARALILEGREAGADGWLLTTAAGQAILKEKEKERESQVVAADAEPSIPPASPVPPASSQRRALPAR